MLDIITELATDTLHARTVAELEALEQEILDRLQRATEPRFRAALGARLDHTRHRLQVLSAD